MPQTYIRARPSTGRRVAPTRSAGAEPRPACTVIVFAAVFDPAGETTGAGSDDQSRHATALRRLSVIIVLLSPSDARYPPTGSLEALVLRLLLSRVRSGTQSDASGDVTSQYHQPTSWHTCWHEEMTSGSATMKRCPLTSTFGLDGAQEGNRTLTCALRDRVGRSECVASCPAISHKLK
jgi:hypothetical protein